MQINNPHKLQEDCFWTFPNAICVENRIKAAEKMIGKVKKYKYLILSSIDIMTFKLTTNTKIVTQGRALDAAMEKLSNHD